VKSLDSNSREVGLGTLWREFLPLSLSDITMAFGDPMVTTALAHLPDARMNLAAVGIAKSLAIFFESPIIMILHASNALAADQMSRKALWRFTLMAGGGLSFLLTLLSVPIFFEAVGNSILGVPAELAATVRQVLFLMGGWAFAIAWRRYFQGLLIFQGQSHAIAKASMTRLLTMGLVLALGFIANVSGAILAGLALIIGVIVEAIVVTIFAYRSGATLPPLPKETQLPQNLQQVWRFYFPLGNTMMVVWGGRALLVGIIARGGDAEIAIASWSAAWGLVLVIANSTRMIQQIIIKYRGKATDKLLFSFAVMVGGICSLLLLLVASTPVGNQIVRSFIGNDSDLIAAIKPVLLVCTGVPLMVAVQNATQGFLVSEGRTGSVNLATWISTGVLLAVATLAVKFGIQGATSAAIAMVAGMLVEVVCLLWKRRLT
jgi:progressive ankylosis protein